MATFVQKICTHVKTSLLRVLIDYPLVFSPQYLRDILSTLTSDDVRHLIQAEDELTQSADMERIFPTHETHKYLGFLAGPRYYNRLFDAWEARYGRNREPGK